MLPLSYLILSNPQVTWHALGGCNSTDRRWVKPAIEQRARYKLQNADCSRYVEVILFLSRWCCEGELYEIIGFVKGVFSSRGMNFRAVFEALYKRNKKYFYYSFFYYLFIDILRLHKQLTERENSKFTKLWASKVGGSKKERVSWRAWFQPFWSSETKKPNGFLISIDAAIAWTLAKSKNIFFTKWWPSETKLDWKMFVRSRDFS